MNEWWDFKNGGQSEQGEHTQAKTMKQGDKTAAYTGRHVVEAAWLSGRGPLDQPRRRLPSEWLRASWP